jgi:1-acyl-sn-glycerol-3-phosphate acyltransferase
MKRRLATIPGLYLLGFLLVALSPLWLPVALIVDIARRSFRLPTVRLLSFAVAWSWLEIAGVTVSFIFWITGQRRNLRAHYGLQRWWARHLLRALRVLCGISVTVDNVDALQPGPVLLFARHASLADSLVSAYVVSDLARMNPRYVLKKELLIDPCLDVVGGRLPNHFLDRFAPDSTPELQALERLVSDMDASTVGIIFPEGTRANPVKRVKAMERISAKDPERGRLLADVQHLMPPRPSGAAAMARGNLSADIVIAWHIGFEGLDSFGGIYGALARPLPPVHVVFERFARASVPKVDVESNEAFTRWLDERWVEIDKKIDSALTERQKTSEGSRHG